MKLLTILFMWVGFSCHAKIIMCGLDQLAVASKDEQASETIWSSRKIRLEHKNQRAEFLVLAKNYDEMEGEYWQEELQIEIKPEVKALRFRFKGYEGFCLQE